jgi:hypothetical protein
VTVTPKRRRVVEEPGKRHSMASASRRAVPGGPAIVSGAVRRENWPSRMRKGNPPKWSPCRWETTTAETSPGSSSRLLSALRDVAPQSSSTGLPPAGRRWTQA